MDIISDQINYSALDITFVILRFAEHSCIYLQLQFFSLYTPYVFM